MLKKIAFYETCGEAAFSINKNDDFAAMPSEEILVHKLSEGDQDAFSYLIDTYSKLLWVVAGGILGRIATTQDIEECVSDVFVHIWQNPQGFDPKKGSLKTFLAVVAKSKALDMYRKLSKNKIVELDEAINSSDYGLLEYIVNKEMCHELYTAIASLPEPNKEIVMRRYFFDEKPAKIAESISLPVKEVENRLYQSKAKLRKHLVEGGVRV
jgi:RNA polymerase sigma-70 factor (ECF subfamily)